MPAQEQGPAYPVLSNSGMVDDVGAEASLLGMVSHSAAYSELYCLPFGEVFSGLQMSASDFPDQG